MGGFKNETINSAFETGAMSMIIAHLTKCSKQMKTDCIADNNLLKNDEDAVTNRLAAVYLNAGLGFFRYEPQASEHYDAKTDHYIGRTDIKVISQDYFRDAKAYYIIECKRIDGTPSLNQKYITEGVGRFFNPVSQPKYSSYYRRNIMFGYVMQDIDIPENSDKIDKLQGRLLEGVIASPFMLKKKEDSQYYIYGCGYASVTIGEIELNHLFFDFADVVYKK